MSDILSWDKAVDKKVKSSDEQDLGMIESITREYIQAKQGLIGKKYYFIPKYYIQGNDDESLSARVKKIGESFKDKVKSLGKKRPMPKQKGKY